MGAYQTDSWKVGLIIARSQPFHNGHVRAISNALMECDEVIISFLNYDNYFFDYNLNQKLGKNIFADNKRISYFGTRYKENLIIPKRIIEHTLNKLKEAHYNFPKYFFHHDNEWLESAKENQLFAKKVDILPYTNSNEIYDSLVNDTTLWKEKVPYSSIEIIETYISNKKRYENKELK
jgi:hypothetical protein